MSTLRAIRRQIESTINVRKITQAMEMVAASRLRRMQKKAEAARPYAEKLKLILENLIAAGDFENPLVQERETKKVGLIIIAGDRGLCGNYNHAIFSTAESFAKHELFLFGRKTVDHFAKRSWPIREKVTDWGGKISYAQIEAFTHQIIHTFLQEELDEIWLIYTHFVSISQRKVVVEKFLPIAKPILDEKHLFKNAIVEPNPAAMYENLLPRYLITKLQTALNESYAAELAARVFAMRAATKNADEMVETLTVKRNKLRQANITRELIEIVSGAEHLT